MTSPHQEGETRHEVVAGSFRDPGSRVFRRDGGMYRALDEGALADWRRLRDTRFFRRGVETGRIVATEDADVAPPTGGQWEAVVRHETIPVVSYPYEWTFSMLRDAALLQLELVESALAEGMILKDATPYNVQWVGSRPVFIDVASFERHERGDPWVGYRQFLQQYLYPLLLTARVGVPFQPFLRGRPDGIHTDEMSRLLGPHQHLRKSSLLHVTLPALAERRLGAGGGQQHTRAALRDAGFTPAMIENNVAGLRRIVESLEWKPSSTWDSYAECDHVRDQRDFKAEFVTQSLLQHAPGVVWDLGTNDGHFARLAAVTTRSVVALDADHGVLDGVYRGHRRLGIDNVLALVQDLADPSPGLGWRGAERPPLHERSQPDMVLCLALVHHLVVGRNLPLGSVIDWLADLDAHIVLEWVPPDDAMVRRLTANKRPQEVHRDYTEAALRDHLSRRFDIEREAAVPTGSRRLFAAAPRR